MFVPDLASCVEANEYYIHNQKIHFWAEALEHCKGNGSILAVLDTQDKLDELSRRLTSQGYKNSAQFWIGLVFNASSRHFIWSSGATVNATSINTTCDIIQNKRSFYGENWCFLLKHVKSKSQCFKRKACDKRLHPGAGYICQPSTQKGIYFAVQLQDVIRLAKNSFSFPILIKLRRFMCYVLITLARTTGGRGWGDGSNKGNNNNKIKGKKKVNTFLPHHICSRPMLRCCYIF